MPYGNLPITENLTQICHFLVCGGSGSGKSVFLLYVLFQLLDMPLGVFIGDFKGSGLFDGITPHYAEFEAITELIEAFYEQYQNIKKNQTGEKILLIIDEYAGYITFLESNDKKKCTAIKGKIAEILMQGRALRGGGSAWLWCVCQRCDSTYFEKSRENFMLRVGFSNISSESKRMLGFLAEDIPENYKPMTGKALLSVDGKPSLRVLQVPKVDIVKLKKLLRIKAERRNSEAIS